MKILFALFARLGDVCCGIPAFNALRRKHPEAALYWGTLPKYASLVPKFGIPVENLSSAEFGWDPGKLPGYDRTFFVQPMYRHDEWTSSGKHIIDLIAQWCGVDLHEKRISIEIPSNDLVKVDSFGLPKRFAAVCSSPTYTASFHFKSIRQAVIDRCVVSGLECVTVGGRDGEELDKARPLHGLSLTESVAVIDRSAIYIGPDNGTTWLACGAPNPHKLCITDSDRLRIGVMGFQRALDDKKVHDIFVQEGLEAILKKLDELIGAG
jgi:hypothetical protein